MMNYDKLLEVIEKPNSINYENYVSQDLMKAYGSAFLPYAMDHDRDTCVYRMTASLASVNLWPMLYLLAMIQVEKGRYGDHMAVQLISAVPDFLEHEWPQGNVLLRATVDLARFLHETGYSTIDPVDAVLTIAKDMEKHFMSAQAIREMFTPIQWSESAGNDPATAIIGQALLQSPELQEKLFSDIKNNRFTPALAHYPKEAMAIAVDRPSRRDQIFAQDLGL